jgi:hypothetical protein
MNYEQALELLQPYIPADITHNDRKDFEAYKQQLLENLGKERRYRSTETLRNERSMIIEGLNTLALRYVNLSFTDLAYGKSPPTPAATTGASSSPTTRWNTPAIRELLTKAFNDEQFSTFCYDHFRPVYDQFAMGNSKPQKIQWLVEHCDREGEMEHLLERIKQKNRYQYHQFESSLRQG